jgi:hypothetical protein
MSMEPAGDAPEADITRNKKYQYIIFLLLLLVG